MKNKIQNDRSGGVTTEKKLRRENREEIKALLSSAINGGMFALLVSSLVWNEANCQFRKNAEAVAACKNSNITDTRLQLKDHIVLYAIGEPDSANILAAWLSNGALMLLESGTTSREACKALDEIARWNDSIRTKVVSMATLIATYATGSLKIQADTQLEKDLVNRIEGFLQNTNAPANVDHDQKIVDGIDRYARNAINAARGPVYNKRHTFNDASNRDNARATWNQGYNKWVALKEKLKVDGRIDHNRLEELIRVLALQTATYGATPTWADTEDAKYGYLWLRKVMHTEIQLQMLAKDSIVTLAQGRPILSAYRPCESCSRTPAVKLWCSDTSTTPLFCTWSDEKTHLSEKPNRHSGATSREDGTHLTAIKQPKGGLGQAWRVNLGTTDDNADARRPKSGNTKYPAFGI